MVDAASMTGALGAAKAAFDLTKAFVDVRDATKVQAVKFELMGLLLEAQEAQAALIADKRDLEERLRELEAWGSEKQRYQLTAVAPGSFAYTVKPDALGSEPQHALCSNCYQHGEKSFLQRTNGVVQGYAVFRCAHCKSEVGIDFRVLQIAPGT